MKRRLYLGDVELEILNIVWDRDEATVQDVVDEIRKHRDTAYTSVMTMMKNLAKKGVLKHRVDGRTYVYSAAVDPDTVRGNLLTDTVEKVFKGSAVELMQNLLDNEKLSKKEIEEIKRMIEEL